MVEIDGVYMYVCDICGEYFYEELNELEDGRFVCDDCLHKCDICGGTFVCDGMWQLGDGRIVCSDCLDELEKEDE